MKACQIIIAILLVSKLFACLWIDINGREASKPHGFQGAVITIVVITGLTVLYWKAGAFSTLIGQ